MPSVVPQSSSRMITSWETSTSLLVRYPESAVRKAVSDSAFLAPLAAMKYSKMFSPSLKFPLIGISMTPLPETEDIRPLIPANCRIWVILPRAPESAIILIGLYRSKLACNAATTSLVVCSQM